MRVSLAVAPFPTSRKQRHLWLQPHLLTTAPSTPPSTWTGPPRSSPVQSTVPRPAKASNIAILRPQTSQITRKDLLPPTLRSSCAAPRPGPSRSLRVSRLPDPRGARQPSHETLARRDHRFPCFRPSCAVMTANQQPPGMQHRQPQDTPPSVLSHSRSLDLASSAATPHVHVHIAAAASCVNCCQPTLPANLASTPPHGFIIIIPASGDEVWRGCRGRQ